MKKFSRLQSIRSIIKFLPGQLPLHFFHGASIISFALLIIFGDNYSQVIYPFAWRCSFLNQLTYILDPLFFHLLIFLLVGYLIWRYIRLTNPKEKGLLPFFFAFGLPGLLLVLSFALELFVFKPAMKFARPDATSLPLGDPWLTLLAKSVLHWCINLLNQISFLHTLNIFEGISEFQDVPSGFALRQMLLFYLTIWITEQKVEDKSWLAKKQRVIIHASGWVSLLYVVFSRLYRANHSLFAMTVAPATSIIILLPLFSIMYAISPKYRESYRSLITETIATYLAFAFVIFTYSNEMEIWVVFTVVLILVISIVGSNNRFKDEKK